LSSKSAHRAKKSHFCHVFDYSGKKSWSSSEIGKAQAFLSNNFSVMAATICALYKARWRVELFFSSLCVSRSSTANERTTP